MGGCLTQAASCTGATLGCVVMAIHDYHVVPWSRWHGWWPESNSGSTLLLPTPSAASTSVQAPPFPPPGSVHAHDVPSANELRVPSALGISGETLRTLQIARLRDSLGDCSERTLAYPGPCLLRTCDITLDAFSTEDTCVLLAQLPSTQSTEVESSSLAATRVAQPHVHH